MKYTLVYPFRIHRYLLTVMEDITVVEVPNLLYPYKYMKKEVILSKIVLQIEKLNLFFLTYHCTMLNNYEINTIPCIIYLGPPCFKSIIFVFENIFQNSLPYPL